MNTTFNINIQKQFFFTIVQSCTVKNEAHNRKKASKLILY